MITSNDLKGIMAMMPAFTTKDGDRIDATDTVDTDELTRAVDKLIRDGGANVITTTGSFGEFHTLLWDEHKKLIEATVAAVKKRVPVLVGCTNLNPREAIRQAKFAQEAGADGLLLGVPFYYQATVDNAVQFYHDVADALPKMGVMIYHNPTHHRVTIPVGAFKKITEKPNIVGMKDSHRTPLQFVELCNITKGKMSVFVNQTQMFPYYQLGAAGCWSFNVWMGPSPVVALREACLAQDWKPRRRSASISKAPTKSGRTSATCPGARMSSNSRSTKPVTAPPDRCARRGELFPRKSKTTARRSRRIGKGFARSIRFRKSRSEKPRSGFVQGSRVQTFKVGKEASR